MKIVYLNWCSDDLMVTTRVPLLLRALSWCSRSPRRAPNKPGQQGRR